MNRLPSSIRAAVFASSVAIFSACGGSSGGGITSGDASTSPDSGSDSGSAVVLSTYAAANPVAAMDAAGNAIVVWTQGDSESPLNNFLYSSYYAVGSGWQTAQRVVDVNVLGSSYRIAVDPVSGRAMLVWLQQDSGPVELWARAFDPASGWGSATPLDASPDSSSTVSVGLDAHGGALVAWSRYANLTSRVFANRYVFGTGWGDPVSIGASDLDWSYKEINVELGVSPAGDAVAVWVTGDGTRPNTRLTSNHFTPSSGWDTVSTVVANNVDPLFASISSLPQIAVDNTGQAILAWSQSHLSGGQWSSQVWTERYADSWQAATPVDSPTADSGWLPRPILAMSPEGSAAIAWAEQDLTLKVSVVPAGGAWGEAQVLSAAGLADSQSLSALSMDGSGNVHAAWNQTGSSGGLWTGLYRAGSGTWTSQSFQDPMADATTGWSPALATNARGDTVLAWTTGYDVMNSGSQVVASYQPAAP